MQQSLNCLSGIYYVEGRYNVCQILIEHGFNIATTDDFGNTGLHIAARNNSGYFTLDVIGAMLESNGAIINLQNNEGQTAIEIADDEVDIAVAILLLENGANSQCLLDSNMRINYKEEAEKRVCKILDVQPIIQRNFNIPLISKLITDYSLGIVVDQTVQNLINFISQMM